MNNNINITPKNNNNDNQISSESYQRSLNNNNNNIFNESLQTKINNLIEIAEQELEYENRFAELNLIIKKQKNENPDYDPFDFKRKQQHSNHSSNSIKKLNSSNANSLASSNNSNVYVDKTSLSLRNKIFNKNNNNNIITNNSNSGDNYNSNFTFNKVASQMSLNTQSSPISVKNMKGKSYEKISNTLSSGNSNSVNLDDDDLLFSNKTNNNNLILRNYFSKKNYAFILFELNNFCFTQKEYFKNIYPELNLVMVIELNDCILSQEKIFFYRTNEDNANNIYYPFLKKEDLKYNKYRIIKPIEMNDEEFPIKISINFFTYTNYKMLPIGSEEIFLKLKKEREMQKFNFYHNMHLKYVNKKVGNTFFNLAYKIDEIYPNQLLDDISNNLETLSVIFLIIFI